MIASLRSKDQSHFATASKKTESPYDEIEKYLAEAKEEILTLLSANFRDSAQPKITSISRIANVDPVQCYPNINTNCPRRTQSHRSLSSSNGIRYHRRKQANSWSQDILKDFQYLVNEEIKTLLNTSKSDRSLTSSNDESLAAKNLVENEIETSIKQSPIMGVNQSNFRDPSQWADTNLRTYTLPRSNQRSISLLGERLLASHPDYHDDPCQLIRVSQNRLSRSYSFDEGQYLNSLTLQHLHMIHEAQRKREKFRYNSKYSSAPEGIYGKIRKSGASHILPIPKLENSFEEMYPRSDFDDERNLCPIDQRFEHSTPKLNVKNAFCPQNGVPIALNADSIQNQSEETWRWMDGDDRSTITDKSSQRPEIVITSEPSIADEENMTEESCDRVQEALLICPKLVDLSRRLERKSEPALPHSTATSSGVSIPGLEVRRHTLPTSGSEQLDVSITPVFSTLSWQTLPPDEEMEVMEVKPIRRSESPTLSNLESENGSSSTVNRSINSSLSSLSHLSVCEDFSEGEMNKIDAHKSTDIFVESRELKFATQSQIYYHKYPTEFLSHSTADISSDSLKDIFVDTTPVLIQLSSAEDLKNKTECPVKITQTKLPPRSTCTKQERVSPIMGVVQLGPCSKSKDNDFILSVSFPDEDVSVENSKILQQDPLNAEQEAKTRDAEKIVNYDRLKSSRNGDDEPDNLMVQSPAFCDDRQLQESRICHENEKYVGIDLDRFMKQVETKIPFECPGALCPSPEENLQQVSSGVTDACTQTTSSLVHESPTSSFSWLSECDGASLEPCTSSMGLSCVESDEFDDDYRWMLDESFSSSSPPQTSLSPVRDDDSSLSLSESLDLLDQNVESGIGTVSTVTSTGARIVTGTLDLSGSNLSSEDTGLETSFERRVKRYLPNTRLVKDNSSLYYKRRKPRLRQSDRWIKCEHRTTQTDSADAFGRIDPPLSGEGGRGRTTRASSEGVQSLAPDPMDHLGRLATSEPRLTSSVSPSCGAQLLPTLSESGSVCKRDRPSQRHYRSVEPVLEMQSKAKSAPLLRRKMSSPYLVNANDTNESIQYRTQSTKQVSEIEALEACKWLRAAGFPQYAQMYEDFQFPLDLLSVERDHSFLDVDSLQALFRRLRILNRCATVRLDSSKKSNAEDSEDEEEECALSGNWQFQRHSRRWSRIDPTRIQLPGAKTSGVDVEACGSVRSRGLSEGSDEMNAFKRSGSERLKEGAKAILRRMESLKSRKKNKRHRDGIVIGSPKVLDEALMQVRMAEMGCVDISPDESPKVHVRGTSQFRDSRQTSQTEDSSSLASDQSQSSSTPRFRSRRKKKLWRRGTSGEDLGVTYSDSECSPHHTWRYGFCPDSSESKLDNLFRDQSSCVTSRVADSSEKPRRPHLRHATSLTYGKESQKVRESFASSLRGSIEASTRVSSDERRSIYDNVPLIICNKNYQEFLHSDAEMLTQEGSGSSECTMESRDSPDPHNEEDERPVVMRATIDRWHSFNRKSLTSFRQLGTQLNTFSVGQMNHLRKRALLKLTALMERHCPSNRTAWNWELPKFMRKMKTPDYRDRVIFGVPLQVINRRMGHPLPPGIQRALAYLKTNCLGQVGIFRKPGVRSRIQKLRELHEANDSVEYSAFGPCDIADLVKTYFRELPEVLLTNKLSEIFITICQYLPLDVRLEALQCVMIMMPDENREALMTLLVFLSHVAANAHQNQMTASNLAVCMAPSLFHLHVGSSGASPLRRKNTGTPEQKDLHDNKAANQCLSLMIQQMTNLQCVPAEMLSNCRFSYLDLSQPVALEDLGSATNLSLGLTTGEGDWSSYMNACITSLLKETRDKNRGWIHVAHPDERVEVGYRKVGDGHPLRLWRVTTEIEAPPAELLDRVLRERHLWDEALLKWRVVARLGRQAEIFQYMCNAMPPRSSVDFCLLRCWRSELGKGICVIVETSVEHSDAPTLVGATRGIVLASRYLIQPCGSGKSKITHISRIDMRGRLPEWYNKNYAHITASHIVKLRQSFRHFSTGPESKV